MALVSRRPHQPALLRRCRAALARARRTGVALALSVGLLVLAACGLHVQTNEPYTPAEGVNVNVGEPSVQVRNLMILSRETGSGFLSASMSASEPDQLVGASGKPYKVDGSLGTALTVDRFDPIRVTAGELAVLTDQQPLIEVRSPDLTPGLTAEVTLMFSTAGSVTIRVPVVDANQPAYKTITPSPAASPSS